MEGSTEGVNQSVAPEGVHGYLLRGEQANQNQKLESHFSTACNKIQFKNKIKFNSILNQCVLKVLRVSSTCW